MTNRHSDKQLKQFAEWLESDGHMMVRIGFQIQDCADLIMDEIKARMEDTDRRTKNVVKLIPEPPTEKDASTLDTEER